MRRCLEVSIEGTVHDEERLVDLEEDLHSSEGADAGMQCDRAPVEVLFAGRFEGLDRESWNIKGPW